MTSNAPKRPSRSPPRSVPDTSWPGAPPDPGAFVPVRVDSPPAGHDFSFVPAGEAWVFLLAVLGTFTPSGPQPGCALSLTTTTAGGEQMSQDVMTTVISSSDPPERCVWRSLFPLNVTFPAFGVLSSGLPAFWLPPGTVVASVTNGILAGDTWTQIVGTFLVSHRDQGSSPSSPTRVLRIG